MCVRSGGYIFDDQNCRRGQSYPSSGWRLRVLLFIPNIPHSKLADLYPEGLSSQWCSTGKILSLSGWSLFLPAPQSLTHTGDTTQWGTGTPHFEKPAALLQRLLTCTQLVHTTHKGPLSGSRKGSWPCLTTQTDLPGVALPRRVAATLVSRAQVTTGLNFPTHCKGPNCS